MVFGFLKTILSNNKIKLNITPHASKNESWLIQTIRMGKSVRHIIYTYYVLNLNEYGEVYVLFVRDVYQLKVLNIRI